MPGKPKSKAMPKKGNESKVAKFYETGLQKGMEFMPIMPPMGYSTDRTNPIVPLPMDPYPTSAFLR